MCGFSLIRDFICHRESFAGTRHAQKRLISQVFPKGVGQTFYGLGLIAFGREIAYKFKLGH
jgi:hypothetical protein